QLRSSPWNRRGDCAPRDVRSLQSALRSCRAPRPRGARRFPALERRQAASRNPAFGARRVLGGGQARRMTGAASARHLPPLARFPEEWEAALAELGEPRYRGKQLFRWIHRRGVFDPQAMSDLPEALRGKLGDLG